MKFTVNTNHSASVANLHLSRNNNQLRKSMARLSSGQRIEKPTDDAGGMAVAMKLESQILRSGAVMQNMLNAISYLEVQDGVLSGAGEILDRMSELKSLYHDVMKNDTDKASYDKEFRDLQVQLFEMSQIKFNGVSLFAQTISDGTGDALFEGNSSQLNTINVFMTPDAEQGAIASIHRSLLLSAITINASTLSAVSFSRGDQSTFFRFASEDLSETITLGEISVQVYAQAIQNIATLRAENGASMSQLEHGYDHLIKQKDNLDAGRGRIMDVDVASESTRFSKYNILVQASTSMLAQANSLTGMALTLLQ